VCADVFLLCSAEVVSTYIVGCEFTARYDERMQGCSLAVVSFLFLGLVPPALISVASSSVRLEMPTSGILGPPLTSVLPRGPKGMTTRQCSSVPTRRRIFPRKSFRLRGHQFCLQFSIATNTWRLASS
jgi:hypothetical protein